MTSLSRGCGTFAAAVVLLTACRSATYTPASSGADSAALLRDVAYLASDALEGRGTGTPGNDSAATYIARRFRQLALLPFEVGTASGIRPESPAPDRNDARYFQPFLARPAAAAHAGLPASMRAQNVVALLPGRDAALRDEYVVIGAHYDHLGHGAFGAADPTAGSAIRNGADDNASGTAAVLELARLLAERRPRRSVIFALFSGEELGLLGSSHFVDQPPVPLARVRAMLNFDMVGRLRDDRLIVYGVATATELPAIVDSAVAGTGLVVRGIGDGFGPSDHSSFYGKDIPVLHFFTDLHDDYHRATDDVPHVNAGGIARVVNAAERVVREIADRPAALTFVRVAAPAGTMSSRQGSNVYLGSVPDMAAGEIEGLRLSGVRAGSPADWGGLRAGDVVVELGGRPVKDLYTYTDALYANQPGDSVRIVVLRGAERLTLTVTLGRRQ